MLIAVELQSCSSLKFKGGEYDGLIRFWYSEHFLFYLKWPSLCIEAELHCHICTSADIFCSGFYCLLRLLNCRLKALHVRRIFHVALNFSPHECVCFEVSAECFSQRLPKETRFSHPCSDQTFIALKSLIFLEDHLHCSLHLGTLLIFPKSVVLRCTVILQCLGEVV